MYGQRCCSSLHSHIHANGYCCRTSNSFHSCAYVIVAAFQRFPFSSCHRPYKWMFFLPLCLWSAALSPFRCPMYGRLCRSFLHRNIRASGCCYLTSNLFRSCAYAMAAASLQFLFSSFRRLYRYMFFLPLCPWSASLSLFHCPMYGRLCRSFLRRNIHASGCCCQTSTPFRSCVYAIPAAFQQFPFSSCHRLYKWMFSLPRFPWSASLSLFRCPMYGQALLTYSHKQHIPANDRYCLTSSLFHNYVLHIPLL